MTTYLRDFRAVQWQRLGDVYAVTFDRGGTTTTVLWTISRESTRFVINAIAPKATLVDEGGNTSTLTAAQGTYAVELPAAICTHEANCFIGGAPRLLVEVGSPADRPGLVPLVSTTSSQESGLEAGEMWGTPSPTPTLLPTSLPSTPTAQPSPLVAQTSPQSAQPTLTPTPMPRVLAQDRSVTPSPQPTLVPLPPITPLSILTPARCLILVIVGLVVFTVTYGFQVALWWRRQR